MKLTRFKLSKQQQNAKNIVTAFSVYAIAYE